MKDLLITTIAAVLLVGCGKSQSKLIIQAAEEGNIEAVKQRLAEGADANAKNNFGETALHKASAEGHREIVELLVANGADVNVKDRNGWTPLHHVAWEDHREIVKLFVAIRIAQPVNALRYIRVHVQRPVRVEQPTIFL